MIKKKILILALLSILLTATLSSASAITKNSLEENQNIGLIPPFVKSEISINATPQIDEPLSPSKTKEIDITVKYKLDLGGPLAKWLFFNRRIGRFILFGFGYVSRLKPLPSAEINLTVEHPDWCTATIEPSTVNVEISNEFKEASAELTLSIINESAPALELNYITIKGEFKDNWRIKGSTNETTISFMPAYISNISYDVKKEQYISPVNETIIPINITNNGNGETIVSIELEDQPEDWNISVDQEDITIPVGRTKQINLIVMPDENFENETINLKITAKSTSDADLDDKYLYGESISFGITLLNEVSPKKEKGFPIPIEILIIAIIVIIVVLVIAILLARKKKQ